MAVTKIWTIKDSLQRVLDYAANPDKTEYDALAQTLHYAENDAKTKLNESAQLVTGIHCRADHAWEDMRAVQERFGKTDGVVALHAYQSFREGEVTPEQCHEIGVALARKVWGKRFQVLVATHMNTDNLHNHFVINSVSYVDGKKYEQRRSQYAEFRAASDKLCREYGLSVVEQPRKKEPARYARMREAIDQACEDASTAEDFHRALYRQGYIFGSDPNRRYATIRARDGGRAVRLYRLGEEYDLAAIDDRLRGNYLLYGPRLYELKHPPRQYLQKQIHDVISQVGKLKAERAENFTVKQMERMRKQLEKKLDKLNDQSRKDDVVTFEELGVDSLMIDEAHAFKNLAVFSKMRNVAGISQTESQRASDLYMKCQYLDEITGGRGVVFATGTPISNSMAEMYTMQRYLQRNTLEQHGLSSFDAWASTFGETVTAIELAPAGTGYRTKTRFSKFYNLPELMAMFKQVADVQTADILNLPVPTLVGGKPINIALPPSPEQRQMVKDLADRAEIIHQNHIDPSEDNMLKVTNDGRKLALDQRLVDPDLPENPNDKIHACAENVFRIWNDTKEKRLTQLVFCDLSTPKPDGFNVYDDLRNLLISMGIPENEVQFIHSANTEVKKAELFAKVRCGDVRVLMGSTGKMGAGTNVQQLLVATHHLDCGWKPSDIEQRNGRMIRQGNTNAEVYEFRYVTESSFDSYMWQLLETKQKFIGQVMTSKSPARSADDLDDAALSYAEVKALAAGNPLIKEKMDLDIQVARLKTLKSAYNNEHYRLEDAITIGFPAEIKKTEQRLENAKADTELLKQNTHCDANGKDIFSITLMDTVYDKREDAGKALLGLLGAAMNRAEPVSIGNYKGFDLKILYLPLDKIFMAHLVGSGVNALQLGSDAAGNIARLDNKLNALPRTITELEENLVQLKKQLENAESQLAQPFAQESELVEKSQRLTELEALLNLNDKEIVLDAELDENQQPRSTERQCGQEER